MSDRSPFEDPQAIRELAEAARDALSFFRDNVLRPHVGFPDETIILFQEVTLAEDRGGGTFRSELTLGQVRRLQKAVDKFPPIAPQGVTAQ